MRKRENEREREKENERDTERKKISVLFLFYFFPIHCRHNTICRHVQRQRGEYAYSKMSD